jgi:hypothetical protein
VEQVWRDHVYQSGLETVDYLRSLAMSPVTQAARRGLVHDSRTAVPATRSALRGPATSRSAVTPFRPGH